MNNFEHCSIPDIQVFTPSVLKDQRGNFFESYNKSFFTKAGISEPFVQDNQATSTYGVIRGLHYQCDPFSQAKLIRVLDGRILDVAVDLRKGSPTWLQHIAIELTAENYKQLYIPKGFAHGYLVLSEQATIAYKCDQQYAPKYDRGIRFNDPVLNIDWGIDEADMILSEKDQRQPNVSDADLSFTYTP